MSNSTGYEFTPRPYQLEILNEALQKNTIVCLGTGTGKTFISVMLIRELADKIKGTLKTRGKRTFFIVNTVTLVFQQSKAIETHTNLKVGKYNGDMGVDFWERDRWEKEFNENDVLVMTAQILLNIVVHGFIKLSNINLLLLDECHHASGSHPYARIMELMNKCPDKPRIMGLTASIINKRPKKAVDLHCYLEESIRNLEKMMMSACTTCFDQNSTLPFAARPVESVAAYNETNYNTWPQLAQLERQMTDLLVSARDFIARARCNKDEFDSCKSAVKELIEIKDSLGLWCMFKAALLMQRIMVRENNKCINEEASVWLKYAITITRQIKKAFQGFATAEFGGISSILPVEPLVTAKAMLLMDQLRERKQNMCAIIFVERRITCTVLSDLINDMVKHFGQSYSGIISDFVHGHSMEEVLRGLTMSSKNQEKILQRFRSGDFNVLVSTSVVEEGVDVRKCNLVVKFDGIKNYREYVQSKGRARAPNASYVVIARKAEEHNAKQDVKIFREIEKILSERCLGRQLPTEDEISEFFDVDQFIQPYKVSNEIETARISEHNAVQLLFMYCSKLTSDRFTPCKPIFYINNFGMESYIGEVKLPMNTPLKDRIRGDPMPTEALARVSAAQKACIRLYEIGELDENFLPVKETDYSDEESDEDEAMDNEAVDKYGNIPSKQVYARKIPDCLTVEDQLPVRGLYLYAATMILTKPREGRSSKLWKLWYEEDRRQFCFFTARRLPEIPPLPLFTKAGEVDAQTHLIAEKISLSRNQLQLIAKFHEKIMQDFGHQFIRNRKFTLKTSKAKLLLAPMTKETCFLLEESCHQFSSHREKDGFQLEKHIDFEFLENIVSDSIATDSCYEDSVVRKTYDEPHISYYVVDVNFDKKVTDRIADDKETFQEYYRIKYGKNIKASQPLLECVRSDARINYITPRYMEESHANGPPSSSKHEIYLVPELCRKMSIPASFYCQAVCIPSLLFRLETVLVAEELQREIFTETSLPHAYNPAKRHKLSKSNTNDHIRKIIRYPSKSAKKKRVCNVNTEKFFQEDRMISSQHVDTVCEILRRALTRRQASCIRVIPLTSILQALTTRKANAGFDLERLEILGDSFLKLAVSVSLFFRYEKINEGRLTMKRIKYISNRHLSKLAKKKNIQGMITNTAFGVKQTGKDEDEMYNLTCKLWIPPLFAESSPTKKTNAAALQPSVPAPSQAIGNKSLADTVEALIGAFYVHGGVKSALDVMQWFGIDCFFSDETKDERSCWTSEYADFPLPKSAALTRGQDVKCLFEKNRYQSLEDRINYQFKDKSFLVQCMTHMSYEQFYATDCYQRLEFLGDSILDFLVVSHLQETCPDLEPGQLTDIKSALVNNNTFALLSVNHKLHKSLLHSSPSLMASVTNFVKNIEMGSKTINSLLQNPFIIIFNDDNEEGFNAPKVLGDIFESLAGAVFLDSGLDLVQVWRIFYPMMQPLIDAYTEIVPLNPVRELHERYPNATKSCKKLENDKIECTWTVNGSRYSGIGQNKVIAKATSAQKALDTLIKQP